MLTKEELKYQLETVVFVKYPCRREKYIKRRFPIEHAAILEHTSFFLKSASFLQRCWHVVNEVWEVPKCRHCGKDVNFKRFCKGYNLFCNHSCQAKFQNPWARKDIKKRMADNYEKKYGKGIRSPSQSLEVKKKIVDNYEKKTGYRYPYQNPEVRKKMADNYERKHGSGIRHNWQNPEVQKKRADNYEKKYGAGIRNPLQSLEVQKKRTETCRLNSLPKRRAFLAEHHLEAPFLEEDYRHCHTSFLRLKCLKCGFEFSQTYKYIYEHIDKCPNCDSNKTHGFSHAEKEVYDYIESVLPINVKVLQNTHRVIFPLELDIYMPSKHLAIEYDGLYYHSDVYAYNSQRLFDPLYHLKKTEACEAQGIRLIHIFEDEWLLKPEIVKSRLKQLLGVSDAMKLQVQKCDVREITSSLKNKFLGMFHIQGTDRSSIKLGAFYNDILVAVMTFVKSNRAKGGKNKLEDTYVLNRFCSHSSFHISGVASALLSFFKKNYVWSEIYVYADRRWSQGGMCKKLGFELDTVLSPSCWYIPIGGFSHISRTILRASESTSEDYGRVYDCGYLKFKMLNQGLSSVD